MFGRNWYVVFKPLNPYGENKVEQWGLTFWEARRQARLLNKATSRFGIFYAQRKR